MTEAGAVVLLVGVVVAPAGLNQLLPKMSSAANTITTAANAGMRMRRLSLAFIWINAGVTAASTLVPGGLRVSPGREGAPGFVWAKTMLEGSLRKARI